MVSFKGKSTTNRVPVNPRAAKNIGLRDFKVYSDLEKTKSRGGSDLVEENALKALPLRKGIQRVDPVKEMKVFDEMGKRDSSVNVKAGRKALADVSNIKNTSSKAGVSNGSKSLRTGTKIPIPARLSFVVKKEKYQSDIGDLEGCADNSLRRMSKRDSSVQSGSGLKMLADVHISNNSSSTSLSNRSNTLKIHNRKSLHAPRVVAGQRTTRTNVPSRKLAVDTSKGVDKNNIKDVHNLKKADTRAVKFFFESRKTKGPSHDTFGIDGKQIVRKHHLLTRKSLPVKTHPIGLNALEGHKNITARDKIKIGRKVVPDVVKTRSSLWKNRASDSFMSVKQNIGRCTLLQRVPVGQNIIDAGGVSVKSPKNTADSSKIEEKTSTEVKMTKNKRRQSFTSSLLTKSEVLRGCCNITKMEKLPSIDDKLNELEVAEYVEDIYKYYWVMEAQYPFNSSYMMSQTYITPKMRGILVNWLIEVHLKYGLMAETLYLMVGVLDRFLSVVTIEKVEMQLVGLTALLLASKYEDYWHPKVKELLSISPDSYTRDQMLATEKLILKKLMFRLNTPTPYVFMLRFLKAAQSDEKLEHLAFYLIELCLTEYEALKYKPSLLSASAIYVARCTLQISPTWTPLLCKHAQYCEPELRDCANMILKVHKASGKGQLKVTYEKYTQSDLNSVARIKALHSLP